MRKAYKYRLYPTRKQEKVLFWTLTRCRELYNAALSERRDSYKVTGRGVTYLEQKRDLPAIKAKLRQEYQQIHSQVLQDVLLRLERAFEAFFRRLQNGEEPGYPRFQGRNRYTSFTYPQGGYTLSEKHVTYPFVNAAATAEKRHAKPLPKRIAKSPISEGTFTISKPANSSKRTRSLSLKTCHSPAW
jgi:transposase